MAAGGDLPAGGDPPPLLEVGRVTRAHGLTGEVVVDLFTERVERLEPGSVLWACGPGGSRRLAVAARRRHQDRYLVRFEGVGDRTAAEGLAGASLQAPPLEDGGTTMWVHQLVGAEVRSTAGEALGRVAAVEANPASDLLVLEGGGLIPLVFVVDHRPGEQVTVEIPAGLLDL